MVFLIINNDLNFLSKKVVYEIIFFGITENDKHIFLYVFLLFLSFNNKILKRILSEKLSNIIYNKC